MTPYTKKIVELHKIHKAIEEKDCCNGGGNTPSGDIGYEEIYQFYKKELIEGPRQEILYNSVIPETFNDIESGIGSSYENGKIGIWHCYESKIPNILSASKILFTTFDDKCIYIGEYLNN